MIDNADDPEFFRLVVIRALICAPVLAVVWYVRWSWGEIAR